MPMAWLKGGEENLLINSESDRHGYFVPTFKLWTSWIWMGAQGRGKSARCGAGMLTGGLLVPSGFLLADFAGSN